MYFYDENKKRISVSVGKKIGEGQYGRVYKLSDDKCIKVYKNGCIVSSDVFNFIMEANLDNFCKLYRLLYNRKCDLKAIIMRFYVSEDIDILTMPMDYVLDNLRGLYGSVVRLAENRIFASDMHTDNVILGSSEITITDFDLYSFSELQGVEQLRKRNILALRYLFSSLFIEAINRYHADMMDDSMEQDVKSMFELYSASLDCSVLDRTCNKLVRYKYPIDYLRRRKR